MTDQMQSPPITEGPVTVETRAGDAAAESGQARGAIGFGLALMALAVYLLTTTRDFPSGSSGEPGPAIWPRIILVGILLLAALMTVRQVRMIRADSSGRLQKVASPDSEGGGGLRSLATMGLVLLYLAVLTSLGYLVSTFAFIVVGLVLLGVRSARTVIPLAVAFPVLVYLVFGKLMEMSLPMGILSGWLAS